MKKDNEIRPIEYSNRAIKNAVAFGVLIRVFLLILIVFVLKDSVDPYLAIDDANYEKLARSYLQNASSIIDLDTFTRIGGLGYLQVF